MSRWTVAAGREILFDGQPVVSLNREGTARPVEADSMAHFLVESLNSAGMTVDELYRRHMGHPPHRSSMREAPRRARVSRRSYSMTYGTLPPFDQFIRDIRRPDPDYEDQAYWPEGTDYPMELVDSHEADLAEEFGQLRPFKSGYSHKVGLRGDERTIYDFVTFLADKWNEGDEAAGDLASSIMTTLGYEWI